MSDWKWKGKWVTPLCLTLLWPHGLSPTRLICSWDSPGKYTGVGGHFLLQEIFLTQELNSGLPQRRQSSPTEPPVQRNVTGLCSIMTQSVLRLCPWEIFTQWKRKIKEEDKTRLELEGMGPGLHHWPGAPVGLGFTPPSLGFLTWKCGCWTARWFYSKKSAIPRTVNQNCLDEMIYHIIQQAYFLAFKNFFLGI